jgi:hypothetical protein
MTKRVIRKPACVGFPQTLIEDGNKHLKVFYPADRGDNKFGWLVIRKEGRIALFQFIQKDDGTIEWKPRITRGKGGKGTVFHYEMPEIPKFIAHQVARAIMDVADLEWGGEEALEGSLAKKKAETIESVADRTLRELGNI